MSSTHEIFERLIIIKLANIWLQLPKSKSRLLVQVIANVATVHNSENVPIYHTNCRSRILDLSRLNRDKECLRFTNLSLLFANTGQSGVPLWGKVPGLGWWPLSPSFELWFCVGSRGDPGTRKVRVTNCYFETFWWNNVHNTQWASSGFAHPFGIKLKNAIPKGLPITTSFAQKYLSYKSF